MPAHPPSAPGRGPRPGHWAEPCPCRLAHRVSNQLPSPPAHVPQPGSRPPPGRGCITHLWNAHRKKEGVHSTLVECTSEKVGCAFHHNFGVPNLQIRVPNFRGPKNACTAFTKPCTESPGCRKSVYRIYPPKYRIYPPKYRISTRLKIGVPNLQICVPNLQPLIFRCTVFTDRCTESTRPRKWAYRI